MAPKTPKWSLSENGKIIGTGKTLTGFEQEKAINKALEAAYKDAGITAKDIEKFGGTGSGKNAVKGSVIVNDIKAIGKAAHDFFPYARTVLDVGPKKAGPPDSMRRAIRLIMSSMKNAQPAPVPLLKP